jgi:polyphenol oxidase
VLAWWTGRAQGDLRQLGMGTPAPPELPRGLSVRRLRQQHGAGVVLADDLPRAGGEASEPPGDALVGRSESQSLAVLVADCAAVALGSTQGVYGAVHVGWRGLLAGVIEEAVAAARDLGARDVVAGLGPCIGPCCYAFDGPPLEELTERYGASVRSVTAAGADALDLPAAVRAALQRVDVGLVHDNSFCTGCRADAWSHRVRADEARQALLVWRVGDR